MHIKKHEYTCTFYAYTQKRQLKKRNQNKTAAATVLWVAGRAELY